MSDLMARLEEIIEREVMMLPDQAPLEHFVHHNNLHHFEEMPFEKAVEESYLNYGKSPYMPLAYFRSKLERKEINRSMFEVAFIQNGFAASRELLDFIMEEIYQFSDISQIAFYRNEEMMFDNSRGVWKSMSNRDKVLWSTIEDLSFEYEKINFPDFHVNRSVNRTSLVIIPFLAAILDQGQADYQLADNQRQSFWASYFTYLGTVFDKQMLREFHGYIPNSQEQVDLLLNQRMTLMGDKEMENLVKLELNMLPGWAGMIYKVFSNKEVIPRKNSNLSLKDYLLMRLILNDLNEINPEIQFTEINPELLIKENVFNYAVKQNIVDKHQLQSLYELFCLLSPLVLRRIFQQAFELTYQNKVLFGISTHQPKEISKVKYQMFFCIDDRECSFRRYVEEVSQGNVATFGVAGFFGFDMMYQKVGEPRPRRLCPPAANPKYLIKESGESYKFKWARMIHFSHSSFVRAATAGFLLAPWRTLEFKLHLYAPRMKRKFIENLKFSKLDKVNILADGETQNGLITGYTYQELATRVAGILKGAGLVNHFANYVMMIGHGHDSFNNPHVAAYRCGACSGANAYPNAKVFAKVANDPEIRQILKNDFGIEIPKKTYFIGGYHDTCNDDVQLYDIDEVSMPSHDQLEIKNLILSVRELNALERCRKFYQAPKNLSAKSALKFVEERAWRIAEPRPELNHATNALCIVGRRTLTKDLFLDRRAFLVSYDAKIDPESTLLAGLLGAVIPVCAGINLEYYFSKVDTENFGSGSKTSHNVTGLLGVMNGIRGDLRTGLVWQMVEYHDPLRILFIIEATVEQVETVMKNNAQVRDLITNDWISLALVNPNDSTDLTNYRNHKFEKAKLGEVAIETFPNSKAVPTGLDKPVDIAYLEGKKYG